MALWIFSVLLGVVLYFYFTKSQKNARKDSLVKQGVSYADATRAQALKYPTALDKTEWRSYPLIKKTEISPNTAIYRFKLMKETDSIALPIGQHLSIMAEIDGKEISRSYTPISSNQDKGYFDLLVKASKDGDAILLNFFARHWYTMGNISKHLHYMAIGDHIRARGPKGTFQYKPNMVKYLGMIAGGTGITPMYQIINHILANKDVDQTRISLVFANVTYDDILLKKRLDELAAAHQEQFKVFYVLNTPPIDEHQVSSVNPSDFPWKGGVGFVTKEILAQNLFPATKDTKVLMCGPPPMLKAMSNIVDELGFETPRVISKPDDQVYKF